MNKFMRLFALLLVVAAIVLFVFAFTLGNHHKPAHVAQSPAPASSRTSRTQTSFAVITASTTLPPGQAIGISQLAVDHVSQKIPHSFTSLNDVVGKVPAITVDKGMPLTRPMLIDDLSLKLEPGERAVAIPLKGATGEANRIHPGDYVDLFFSLKSQDEKPGNNEQHSQARLLLPRLRVLAFGHRDLPTPATATSSAVSKSQQPQRANTAVLAVPVAMVNRLLLVMAHQHGKLTLVLRNPHDQGMPDPELFPQPGPVLIARTSAHKAVAGDPPSASQMLDSAENTAYAGIALNGLAQGGQSHPSHTHVSHHAPRTHRVEIIRGTRRGHITVSSR